MASWLPTQSDCWERKGWKRDISFPVPFFMAFSVEESGNEHDPVCYVKKIAYYNDRHDVCWNKSLRSQKLLWEYFNFIYV